MPNALNLFAGAGGSCLGTERAGFRSLGVEKDPAARKSRDLNDLITVGDDVRDFCVDRARNAYGGIHGVWASPPCPSFSVSGDGHGREFMGFLVDQIPAVWSGEPPKDLGGSLAIWSRLHLTCGLFAVQVIREAQPSWVVMENVQQYRPFFRKLARTLQGDGWSVWTGNLSAEQYGVPQTRKRALLLASREREVTPPPPTHQKMGGDDSGLPPAITVAEVLVRHDLRDWMYERPSTTIMGKKICQTPGRGRTSGNMALSFPEMLALQGMPLNWKLYGKSKQAAQQVGNMVPPQLAFAAIRSVANTA